jgi:hypothetical protein
MYLVSPDYLNGKSNQPSPPPLVSKEAKMPGTAPLPKKKQTNKKSTSKRTVKKKKNGHATRGYNCAQNYKKPISKERER